MKKSKIIFAIVLVMALSIAYISNINSTVTTIAPEVKVKKYDAGLMFYTAWSAVDSATTYESDYFDISAIDGAIQGSTIKIGYSYTTPGNTSDSLTLTLQGKDANDVVYSLGTALLIGSTSGTATLTTLSVTNSLPFVNFKVANTSQITNNRDCTGLTISAYNAVVDNIPQSGSVRW